MPLEQNTESKTGLEEREARMRRARHLAVASVRSPCSTHSMA